MQDTNLIVCTKVKENLCETGLDSRRLSERRTCAETNFAVMNNDVDRCERK